MELMNYKNKVRDCFNKAELTYDSNCSLQVQIGTQLISKVKMHMPSAQNIIDLGCGTGLVTKLVADEFKHTEILAIDIASKLLKQAGSRLHGYKVNVIEADFDSFTLGHSDYDQAFANMSLQWAPDLKATFVNINKCLKTGGILAFSIPLKNSLEELGSLPRMEFNAHETVLAKLGKSGFKVIEYSNMQFVATFDLVLDALKSVKAVGANYVMQQTCKSVLLKLIKQNIGKAFPLTYNIGFFITEKI